MKGDIGKDLECQECQALSGPMENITMLFVAYILHFRANSSTPPSYITNKGKDVQGKGLAKHLPKRRWQGGISRRLL